MVNESSVGYRDDKNMSKGKRRSSRSTEKFSHVAHNSCLFHACVNGGSVSSKK